MINPKKVFEDFEKECYEISKRGIQQIQEDIKKIKNKYLKELEKEPEEDYMDVYIE